MVERRSNDDIIPASLPDDSVPAIEVETSTATKQKTRRARRFLKGPIPLPQIREHIRNSADRLLLVLWAHSDMRQSAELKVTADILRDAGICNRKAAYRALSALESAGSLTLRRHQGRRPIVQLKPWKSAG